MNLSAEAKLQELRSKTDRQLASLINNRLDYGLALARVPDEDSQDCAGSALAEASEWFALLDHATTLERRRLEFKLDQLRGALDQAPQARVQAAC